MLLIENENFTIDITYSNNKSRPSKTLLNTELYLNFLKCKIDPYYKLKEYTLKECIRKNFESYIIKDTNIILNECSYRFIENKNYFQEILCNLTTNCIIEINNVFTYTQIQFILILSSLFKNTWITNTMYKNCLYIICNDKNNNIPDIKKSYIKDFNGVITIVTNPLEPK